MEFLIHKSAGLIFALYILVDRLYLRKNIEKQRREKFYSLSKFPMAIIAVTIIVSGVMVLDSYNYEKMALIKGVLGVVLIAMFFACPIAMKKLECDACKARFRGIVSILLLLVLALGIYIP